jgi:hypothetical protein
MPAAPRTVHATRYERQDPTGADKKTYQRIRRFVAATRLPAATAEKSI